MFKHELVKKYRIGIVVVFIFILFFVARVLFGTRLSFGEVLLNLPLYLITGVVYGFILQALNKWLSTKGLLSLLIYPIIGMTILVQFLFPPILTFSWEPAAALYNGEQHVADILLVPGNCRNAPLGYTTVPIKKPDAWYVLSRLIRLLSLDGCACKMHDSCLPTLDAAIVESELLNETGGRIVLYEHEVFTVQGAYLAMPIAEEGCHYSGFVKFVAVPSWLTYLREGGQLCYD